MHKGIIITAIIVLALGSFTDEAMITSFALTLSEGNRSDLTWLFAASMIGGVVASRMGAYVLPKVSERILLPVIFALQGVVIGLFYMTTHTMAILCLSFLLGLLGALLWTVFLAVLPDYFAHNIALANKLSQTIKNAGFVFAPAITGLLFASIHKTLILYLSLISFVCMALLLCVHRLFKVSNISTAIDNNTDNSKVNQTPKNAIAYRDFILHPTIKKALLFFTISIALTSALNILLIVYINQQLHLSAFIYGATLSMMSLGLLLSPMLLSGLFGKLGQVSGSYLAAALMGVGMVGFACVGWLHGVLMVAMLLFCGLLIGVGNGVQNTLMNEFMLNFCGKSAKQLMPHYILTLQIWVLVGFLMTLVITGDVAGYLLVFGVVVMACGVLGAWLNWGGDTAVWRADLTDAGQ